MIEIGSNVFNYKSFAEMLQYALITGSMEYSEERIKSEEGRQSLVQYAMDCISVYPVGYAIGGLILSPMCWSDKTPIAGIIDFNPNTVDALWKQLLMWQFTQHAPSQLPYAFGLEDVETPIPQGNLGGIPLLSCDDEDKYYRFRDALRYELKLLYGDTKIDGDKVWDMTVLNKAFWSVCNAMSDTEVLKQLLVSGNYEMWDKLKFKHNPDTTFSELVRLLLRKTYYAWYKREVKSDVAIFGSIQLD